LLVGKNVDPRSTDVGGVRCLAHNTLQDAVKLV